MPIKGPVIDEKTVVIGMAQEPDGMAIKGQSTVAAGAVMNTMFCALIEWNDDWKPYARVAEKLPSLEDGSWEVHGDRMIMHYRLRPGYKWHDGTPVTADDVLYGWQFCLDPRLPIVTRWIEAKIESIVVKNDLEFDVHWKERLPHADLFFGAAYGASFVPRRVYEPLLKGRDRLDQVPLWDHPMGNGPYRFDYWRRGEELSVRAVEDFVEGPATIKRLVYRFYPDAASLKRAQIAGEVDCTELNNFSLEDMAEIEEAAGDFVATHYSPAIEWEHIDVNLDDPVLSDVRVRRALLHAFNREAAVKREFRGRVNVAHTWLGERYYAFHPGVPRYEYEPDRASQLLDQAGWRRGPDGIRRNAGGERLTLTLSTTAGNQLRRRIAAAMTEDLARAGIELKLEELPAQVLIADRLRKRQFQLVMLSWVMSPTAPGFGLWHSSQIPSPDNNYTGQNFCGWRSAENDRLIAAVLRELDTAKRIELFHRQQEQFAADLPSLPLYFRIHLQTSKRSLLGVRPVGLSGTYLPWNAHTWRWGS
ncbi:MAG: peptide ABC transporter substrate-binding protein [Acetobacteraceae bacterium]|nr:peptide ABC transporter substrate-binding protein [Acetobacteraceae bacterium]